MSIPSLDDFNKKTQSKKTTKTQKRTNRLDPQVLGSGKEVPEGYRRNGFGVVLPAGVQDFNQNLRDVPGGKLPSLNPPAGADFRLYMNTAKEGTKRIPGGISPANRQATEEAPESGAAKTLADYLQQALSMLGSSGGNSVNYDPQRATARSQAAENDARLEAMYRQLRGSIDADAPVLQQAYQTAIDSTAQNAATAQQQTQAASDAASSRNNEVLANLGIQQAQGNIIQNGTDLNTQTAGNIAAQATKGQAAGDRLVSNQATALQHNTNIGNAAGLEGNLQRATNQAKLQALLADIDMAEQQANQSSGTDSFSQQLSLANSLMDFDRYNSEQENSLQQSAAELAAKQSSWNPNDFFAWIQAQGLQLPDASSDPKGYADLLTALRKAYAG